MARHPGTPVGDLFPPGVAIFGAGGGQGQQALPSASSQQRLVVGMRGVGRISLCIGVNHMFVVLHIKRTSHHPSAHCPNLSGAKVVHRRDKGVGACWGGGSSFKQQVLVRGLAPFGLLFFFWGGGGGVGRTSDDADMGSDAVWVTQEWVGGSGWRYCKKVMTTAQPPPTPSYPPHALPTHPIPSSLLLLVPTFSHYYYSRFMRANSAIFPGGRGVGNSENVSFSCHVEYVESR